MEKKDASRFYNWKIRTKSPQKPSCMYSRSAIGSSDSKRNPAARDLASATLSTVDKAGASGIAARKFKKAVVEHDKSRRHFEDFKNRFKASIPDVKLPIILYERHDQLFQPTPAVSKSNTLIYTSSEGSVSTAIDYQAIPAKELGDRERIASESKFAPKKETKLSRFKSMESNVRALKSETKADKKDERLPGILRPPKVYPETKEEDLIPSNEVVINSNSKKAVTE